MHFRLCDCALYKLTITIAITVEWDGQRRSQLRDVRLSILMNLSNTYITLLDPHLSALEVRFSRRGAIQIYIYLYLYG